MIERFTPSLGGIYEQAQIAFDLLLTDIVIKRSWTQGCVILGVVISFFRGDRTGLHHCSGADEPGDLCVTDQTRVDIRIIVPS